MQERIKDRQLRLMYHHELKEKGVRFWGYKRKTTDRKMGRTNAW